MRVSKRLPIVLPETRPTRRSLGKERNESRRRLARCREASGFTTSSTSERRRT